MQIWKELIYWKDTRRDEYKVHIDFAIAGKDFEDLSKIRGLKSLGGLLGLMPSNNGNGSNDYRIHLEGSVYLPVSYRKIKNKNYRR